MKKTTIAGLEFELKFCKKINQEPLEEWGISKIPLANMYNSIDSNTFTVNILSYIPTDFKTVKNYNQTSIDLLPNEEDKLFFSYNGVSVIKTPINKNSDNSHVLCRNFSIDYDSSNGEPVQYNLYHVQLHYKILANNGQSVEGIMVHDTNFDPETTRGTFTTVRDDYN